MPRKPRNLIERKKRMMDQAIDEINSNLASIHKEQKKAFKKIKKTMKELEKPLEV